MPGMTQFLDSLKWDKAGLVAVIVQVRCWGSAAVCPPAWLYAQHCACVFHTLKYLEYCSLSSRIAFNQLLCNTFGHMPCLLPGPSTDD